MYRMKYKENKPLKRIFIICIIIVLVCYFRPLSWLKKTLSLKSIQYKSTHETVDFDILKKEEKYYPMKGTIISRDNNGINISPTTSPIEVRIINTGVVTEVGYNYKDKNYVKVRHILQNSNDIFYSYYSNLPSISNVKEDDWVGSSTIIYSGKDLDYLHFEILDYENNKIDTTEYINIE